MVIMYLQSGTTNGNPVQNTVHIGPTNGYSRFLKVNRPLINGQYALNRVHIGRNDCHPVPQKLLRGHTHGHSVLNKV